MFSIWVKQIDDPGLSRRPLNTSDTYDVLIRIRKSKKDRQRNGQKKKDKQRSTKHTHKTKDRATW